MNHVEHGKLVLLYPQAQPLNLVLRFSAEGVPMLSNIILQLGEILIRHGKQNDFISLNLMRAGHAFMVYVAENINRSSDDLLNEGIQKIQIIARLLQNPHGQGLLKDPWLVDNTTTWERTNAEAYQCYAAQFDNKQLEISPHVFAKEVIDWIQRFPIDIDAPADNLLDNPTGSRELIEYKCYKANEALLNQTLNVKNKLIEYERQLEHCYQRERIKQAMEEENLVRYERLELVLARQEESQLQQTAELQRGLSALEVILQETRDYQEKTDKAKDATVNTLKSNLDQAYIELNRQQAQIYNLYLQLQSSQAEINNLNNRSRCVIS